MRVSGRCHRVSVVYFDKPDLAVVSGRCQAIPNAWLCGRIELQVLGNESVMVAVAAQRREPGGLIVDRDLAASPVIFCRQSSEAEH